MAQDYYSILGVSKSASPEEIKKAYRLLARKFHPDVNKDKDAQENFKKINEAYSVLSDSEKKQRYDQFGSAEGPSSFGQSPFGQGDFSGAGNFSDIFEQFFGGSSPFSFSFGEGGTGRRERDLSYPLTITLKDAFLGTEKRIRIRRLDPCAECKGEGGFGGRKCQDCKGSGRKATIKRTILGTMQTYGPCNKCRGSGRTFERECSACDGSGQVEGTHEITVKIPAGIASGNRLRLEGEGELGGDLYILVDVEEDERFQRKGADLLTKAPINLRVAALGGKIQVETLDGKAALQIPEGTESGEILKVAGKGMPLLREEGRGDLFVKVIIETPKKLSQKQKDLLRQLFPEEEPRDRGKGFFGI